MSQQISYYVRGGLYEDDSFCQFITEDSPIGPFTTWESAYASWEAVSWHHLDEALRRYYISNETGIEALPPR